jgi:PAS domain S-box-containing protein
MNAPQEITDPGASPDPVRRRADDVLARMTAAAIAVSSVEGPALFADLTRRLAEILQVDATLIAVFTDASRTRLQTLAAWLDGHALRNFEYELAKTPCRAVVGRESRFVASGVHHEFDPHTLFAAKGFDSYAAHSLMSATGEQLGMAVALDRCAMEDRQLTEALLKIFATRAAAEVERSRAEQSYRAIFDAAEDVVFVHDWDSGVILDVSAKSLDLYGYAPRELRNMQVGDFSADVRPYTAADAAAHIERAKQSDAPHRFEWLARHRDGRLLWNEVTLKRADIGGHRRVLGFVRDITARKSAEQALQMREQQYRAIFDGSADAMVLWNADLRIVDVNDAFTGMYGFARSEVVGSAFGDRIPTVDVGPRLERLRRALQGEEQQLEIAANHKDGSRFEVELRYLPIQHLGAPHVLAIARDNTQRKAAEAALRDSEAQYRGIFNASADALVLWNSERRIVDVNPAYERIYRLRREEVVGSRYPTNLPPAYVAGRLDLVRRALAGELCELQGEAYRGDGSRFEVELRVLPIQHRGRPHALAIARDITERKRAEDALRNSEAQYRAIFAASADALLLWNAEFRVVDVNPAYERFYGKTRDQVIGKSLAELLPLRLVEQRREMVQRALDGATVEVQTIGYRQDGASFELELRLMPFLHRGQRHVLAIGRDITEAKRAEDALRVSEARYRLVFDTESDALVLVDVETLRLVDVNRAAVSLYGRSRAELLQMTALDLSAEPDETRQTIQGGEGALDIPTRLHRDRSGRTFPVEIKANRLLLDGRMTVVAAIRDISERQRLEAQLRQAQKMEAIGQLAGGIAHDFNNILTSILGYIVLAQERATDAGDVRSATHLEQAMAGCRRARDVVQQLLTFARGQRARPEAVDLCDVVRESVPLLRASIAATIALDYDCETQVPYTRADRVQIEQVLLNLVLNARDALGGAEGRGQIAIGVGVGQVHAVCSSCRQRIDGRFVQLTVHDDGPGMAQDLAERVFEPFFSTKPPGPNSGMGLAMVHGIVHDHRGHVLLQTAPGAGSSFCVLLPLAQSVHPSEPAAAPSRAPRRKRLHGRVLVVDDEHSVRDFLAELLAGWGLHVDVAAHGAEGLERVRTERFHLVLTDQTMPGLDGLALARAIMALPEAPPVLLMSGLASVMQVPLAHSGVRALLAKPLEPAALFAELQQHLPPEPAR